MAIEFNDKNFEEEVLKSTQPVLVDFWATWCSPCQMMSPIVDDVAEKLQGKAKVGKINVDESPGVSQKYGIMSIPTMIIFKNGAIVKQLVGVQSRDTLVEEMTNIL